MPRFSESLFESIRNFGRMSPTEGRRRALEQPTQYQQMGTTDPLARSLGKMFGGLGVDTSYMQTAPERIAAETEGLDMSTIEGQQQAIQAELQYVQDPQARRALGLRLMELNKLKLQQEELALKKQQQLGQQTAVEQVALSLESEYNDSKTAELLRTGAITPQQGNARRIELQKSAAASANGKSGKLARLRGLGLQDSELFRQVEAGKYEGVSDTQFASIVSDLEEANKVEQQIDFLRKRERNDLAEQLEMGMITSVEAGNKLSAAEPTTQYSNKKRMILDGKVVWTADVTMPGQDEFPGYMDPETKKWKPVDAERLQKISEEQQQSLKDINLSDLTVAANYLGRDSNYIDLSPAEQDQAKFKFAFRVNELIRNKEVENLDEAYEIAYEERGEFQKEAWWEGAWEGFKEVVRPKKQADEYIKEAKQVPQQ